MAGLQSSFLYFSNSGVTGVCHHIQHRLVLNITNIYTDINPSFLLPALFNIWNWRDTSNFTGLKKRNMISLPHSLPLAWSFRKWSHHPQATQGKGLMWPGFFPVACLTLCVISPLHCCYCHKPSHTSSMFSPHVLMAEPSLTFSSENQILQSPPVSPDAFLFQAPCCHHMLNFKVLSWCHFLHLPS